MLGDRFCDALVYTSTLHRHQTRKGSTVPYVAHLLAVASLVLEDGGEEDDVIAALLHDAVEDQGGDPTAQEIARRFGPVVGDIVGGCTEVRGEPKPPWEYRKRAYLDHLADPATSDRVLRVALADKVHNGRCILADYRQLGEALWERFTVGRDDQLWYYRQLVDIFERRRAGPLTDELRRVVAELTD
jgi:(p)ppGpp synthase/HD superfamily hydrolase